MINFTNLEWVDANRQEVGDVSLDDLSKKIEHKKELERFRRERPHFFILPQGESVIRIISKNPFQHRMHFYTDPRSGSMRRATCLGKECKVCNSTLLKERERKAVLRFAFWIIDPNKELKVFEVGRMLFESIYNALLLRFEFAAAIDPIKYDLAIQRTGDGMKTRYRAVVSKFQRNLKDEIETNLKVIERFPIDAVITGIDEVMERAIETQRILDKNW